MTPDLHLLIAHGLHVLPVQQAGKIPLINDWPNVATSDPGRIAAWLRQWPGMNVGIATGMKSGIVVLDIDPRHGGDETLALLQREHGDVQTWAALTGGGGQHMYFRHPGTHPINNSAGIVGQGLDIRGDGGFVVAPPSLHSCGRPYAWDVDHHPDDECLADLPDWIVAKIDRPHVAAKATLTTHFDGSAVAGEIAEGKRNNTLASVCGHLLRRRCDPRLTLTMLRAWNAANFRPPLADDEVAAVFNSIAQRELDRRAGHAA
jgi:putative DNA primase/helicase